MQTNASTPIYNIWYVAVPSGDIVRGQMKKVMMLNQALLIGRGSDGAVFALKDFCPHRGIPLSYGKFDGQQIECCYHGWCFNTQGACTKIPSLTPEDTVDVSRIRTGYYPCKEDSGAVWVYMPEAGKKLSASDEAPEFFPTPGPAEKSFTHVTSVLMPCNIDHAVIGLMDPSHGPFVHASWWWRSRTSIRLKEKAFEPTQRGFRMKSHKPSSNSKAYKILVGGDVTTEITFELPGLRTEHITVGGKHIVLLTALSPVDDANTMLHQFIYTDMALVKFLIPLVMPFGKAFINQDLDIVKKQQEGLRDEHPSLMLLGGADTQALWYFRLKKEYQAAQEAGVHFENPLPAKILRWMS
jgi:phenylpropionate dioxygenase-like ring-hydroxylating dioxygenase large terminal subunit